MGALKDAIRANGQTVSGVARLLGVNRASVECWDRGLGITPDNLRALESAVGVALPFLTAGRHWVPNKSGPKTDPQRSVGTAEDAIRLEIGQLERRIKDVDALRRRVAALRAALTALGEVG
jgi:hypothetical protein